MFTADHHSLHNDAEQLAVSQHAPHALLPAQVLAAAEQPPTAAPLVHRNARGAHRALLHSAAVHGAQLAGTGGGDGGDGGGAAGG